eukprot:TRINITY_DN68648_c0_g1_i1.p1 TRINITY_DN68648_c0_g1~~TRINITY_DN68648_c0_g1_i1.p1  ORF type:complete len:488 (+),score=90.61 TRINITY_DN68648_c0_g1_i1:186-1649(+)
MPALSLDVPVELIKDPSSWDVEDIGIWLQWLGIGEHAEAFAARGVDGIALLRLNAESAWADLGVVDPAQQRVLDSAVEPLRGFQDSEGAETGLALHAVEGPIAGEVIFVGAGGITGGRHSVSNGIVLSENYVSRRHFQITRDLAAQYWLQDVGSTTGTFLMVRQELPLEHMMVLQLGTTELTVYVEDNVCTLVATEGPDKDARAVVTPQGLFIGREPSNGLCIRDPQISAFHCEVRTDAEQGFILDDKYSTNRTWLRLAPDGEPSKSFMLRVGDLFKVGSTLFHVIDPNNWPESANVAGASSHGFTTGSRPSTSLRNSGYEELDDSPSVVNSGPLSPSGHGSEADGVASGLRWEPFVEGDVRPLCPPEEYARKVTESRRQMHSQGTRRGAGTSELQPSQVSDVQQRELSSLQQGMRNSRAQTAYTLQQQRPEERRDEDLCKICYDKDIDVVLYPCGHFILCRWCAFKVSDCPVCRQVITHVIRTYKS